MSGTLEDDAVAAHKAFMAELGEEASVRGFMPPMDVFRAYRDETSGQMASGGSQDEQDREITDLHQEGNAAMRRGDASGARDLYTRALETIYCSGRPRADVMHVLFGNRSAAALRLADANEAVEDARSCLASNPDYVKGWFRLASALAEKGGDSEGVTEAAEKGLQLDPGNRELSEILNSCCDYGMEGDSSSSGCKKATTTADL